MLPVVARADTVTIKASGTCGDSAYWKLSSDRVLTVYGSGAMSDYSVPNSSFTYNIRSDFDSVVVENGITRLGNNFLYGKHSDFSVSLPDSLISIGDSAFNSCGFSSFSFPSNIVSIGYQAFYKCSNLSSIDLPSKLQSLGSFCFSYSGLTSISIPSSLLTIGTSCFSGCSSLETVNVLPAVPPSITGSTTNCSLFLDCPDTLRIYVPDVAAYESAPGWSDYAAWIVGGYSSGGGNSAGSGSGGTITGPDYTYHLEVDHTRLDDYFLDTDLQFWAVWSAYAGNDTQIDRSVTWTVDGLSNETYIDSSGLLHIGAHESRQYLNIRATSVYYPDLYAYAVIELTHMTEEEANTPTTSPTEDNSEVLGAIDDLDQDVQQLQDSVDTLIEGDENSAAASDELGSASKDVSDAMVQVDDFQQSQMDVLDDNMQQIQDSVDFSGFVPALEFIMEQVNSIFDGIGDVSVILTFPLYLGLFFYICSRAPGGTISKISRFKSIDGKAGGEKV